MHFSNGALGDVDRGVVAARGDRAIRAIVLGDRRERIRRREVGALETAHLRLGNARAEPGVLSRALGAAPPTRVARTIQHGCEGHRHSWK